MNEVVWAINNMIGLLLIAVGVTIYWIFKYDEWNPNPVLLLMTPVRAEVPNENIVNPIFGPESDMNNSIIDWNPTDMQKIMQTLRDWESAKDREPVEDMLNRALLDFDNGSNATTEQEELLQFSSSND